MNNKIQNEQDYNQKLIVKDKAFTPLQGVQLKEGLFKRVFDNNANFLKTLDVDSMLYWFRMKAEGSAPGEPYRGHFEDNIKGQTAGMYLMGAGNSLRWEEDGELRDTLNKVVACIDQCSEPDGYIMAVPKSDFGTKEYPHYVRIWLNYGLTAAGYAGNDKAFEILRRWQDWFNQCGDLPIIKYLVLSFQGIVASTSVYTGPVGKWDDIDVAMKYYEEDWRLAQFIFMERDAVHTRKQPGWEPHPHGTELESFEGYLDLYRATGRYYYLNAVMGAYNLYREDWRHPGGGIVMCENIDTYPGSYWLTPEKHYNELCCTSFWMGLNQRLHRLFPEEEKYVNEIEQSLYNICIANQDGSSGIRYFAWLDQYKDKGKKVTCCCGVGTRIFGSLPEYLYSISDDGIYVDIYAASQMEWSHENNTIRLETETRMPYDSNIKIKISVSSPDSFKLRLRIPSWTAGMVKIKVNGVPTAEGKPGSFCELDRSWRDGDTVEFKLPMEFLPVKYTGAEQIEGFDRYAYMYGPILFAVKGELESCADKACIVLDSPYDRVHEWAVPCDRPLAFKLRDKPGYELTPYFEIAEETFTCFPCFRK